MDLSSLKPGAVATLAVLSALGLACCGVEPVDGQSQRIRTDKSTQPLGERLLAKPPGGWARGFATQTPTLTMVEYLPEDPGDADWVEKVSFESFSAATLPDPIEFVTAIATEQAAGCENFEHFNVLSGQENGYPTSVRFMACPKTGITGKSQVTLVKAIRGNHRFYVITRAKRIPVAEVGERGEVISANEMAIWSTYIRAIGVCDAELFEVHPCPGS